VLIALLFNYIVSPKPFFDIGSTRINYWPNSKFNWLRSLFGNISSFVPIILGFRYYLKRKKMDILIFVIYLLYLVLIGQKGGVLIEVLLYFLTPFSVEIVTHISYKKLISYASLILAIVFLVAYYSYNKFNPYSGITDDVGLAILYRLFALQNALTSYAVDTYFFEPSNWDYSFLTLSDGMSALMNDLPSFSDVDRESQISVGRLTNAYPGNLFKFSALLSPFILCLLVGLFYITMIVYTRSFKNIGFGFLLIFQLFSMAKGSLFMGDLGLFFIYSFVLIIFAFFKYFINFKKTSKISI
jgi:hypothetical protein